MNDHTSGYCVEIDRDACVGAGLCVRTAPHVFTQEIDGFVGLLNEHPQVEAYALIQSAVQRCPGRALSIRSA